MTAGVVFRGDRRSACVDIRQSGQLAYLLSTHADRHVVDISFTVCFLCVSAGFFVRDISGVDGHRAMKFGRVVDFGVRQVLSPFGEIWPMG